MSSSKRPRLQTSMKQVLTRDFNWRMGNLRRLQMSVKVLTNGRDAQADRLIREEISMETSRHGHRLWRASIGEESQIMDDWIWEKAKRSVETNRQLKALQRMSEIDERIMKDMSPKERERYMHGD